MGWFLGLLLWLALAEAKSIPTEKRSTVCYGDLGCFGTESPFFSIHRPLNFLPAKPESIATRFKLYTRAINTVETLIKADDPATVKNSNFHADKPTKVIVHGFIDNGQTEWMKHMKDELLVQGDFNVIIVDWGKGSLPPYTQATANTRVVGAEIAKLITKLQQNFGAKPETFHIIGHSLGSHIAGYAGERLRFLGRITGLDPAEPYFQNTDKVVRLDPTDALFVDVIHTDGESILKLGYGMIQACGHVDYYPNGGLKQPGCDNGPVTNIKVDGLYEGVKQFVACNHLRAYDLFTESINSVCPFEGYHCETYEDFENGKCLQCNGNDCGYMGFHSDRAQPKNGQSLVKYFLQTGADKPFCRYHYEVSITIATTPNSKSEHGKLFIDLIGQNGQTGEVQLGDDYIDVNPGQNYSFIVTSPKPIGQLVRANFRWDHSSHLLNPLSWNILGLRHPALYIDRLDFFSGEEAKRFSFCAHSTAVETDTTLLVNTRC